MGMFFALEDGLWTLDDAWMRVDCPLEAVQYAAISAGHVAAIDDRAHRLYLDGALLPCDRDVEALRLWRGHALTLSSDTDCLSIADPEGWLVTVRSGMYPQDMCILGDEVLVCGGTDGRIHRLTLPDLLPVCSYTVPGIAMRLHAAQGTAHVLCTNVDETLHTQYCRVSLSSGLCEPHSTFPGLPGAIRADPEGGLWLAAGEALYRMPPCSSRFDGPLEDFGLIRHIDVQNGIALVTDPLLERCALVTKQLEAISLYEGAIGQAGYC